MILWLELYPISQDLGSTLVRPVAAVLLTLPARHLLSGCRCGMLRSGESPPISRVRNLAKAEIARPALAAVRHLLFALR